MPSVGLVQQQTTWAASPAPAPIAQLLLLAAGKIAAAAARASIAAPETSENTSSGILRCSRLERPKPSLEVFLHREQRKDLAALRHEADALARPLIGFSAP